MCVITLHYPRLPYWYIPVVFDDHNAWFVLFAVDLLPDPKIVEIDVDDEEIKLALRDSVLVKQVIDVCCRNELFVQVDL